MSRQRSSAVSTHTHDVGPEPPHARERNDHTSRSRESKRNWGRKRQSREEGEGEGEGRRETGVRTRCGVAVQTGALDGGGEAGARRWAGRDEDNAPAAETHKETRQGRARWGRGEGGGSVQARTTEEREEKGAHAATRTQIASGKGLARKRASNYHSNATGGTSSRGRGMGEKAEVGSRSSEEGGRRRQTWCYAAEKPREGRQRHSPH